MRTHSAATNTEPPTITATLKYTMTPNMSGSVVQGAIAIPAGPFTAMVSRIVPSGLSTATVLLP